MRLASLVLLCAAGGVGALLTANTGSSQERREQERETEEVRGAAGFFGRAFQQAKRLGEAIDPEAVAQVEQAWKEVAPDLRQAADDLIGPDVWQAADDALQGKTDVQVAVKEAVELWSAFKQAVSGSGSGGDQTTTPGGEREEATTGLGWEGLKKDVARAAAGAFGDVFGEVTDEVISTFESGLSEALSEDNLRTAFLHWRRLLDTPGVRPIAQDRRLWASAKTAVRQHLSSYMSESSATEAEKAVNATADFALHFAGLSRNTARSDQEVFEELSDKLCHLQGAAEKLWPLVAHALPFLGYGEHVTSAESAIRSHVLSRITLTVAAGALLGLDPREDPFLMTIIAAFSLGNLTKDVAQNMAAFFQKVFMDQTTFDPQEADQTWTAAGDRPSMSPVQLAGELVSDASTCKELGYQAFDFFEMVQRALSGIQHADDCAKDVIASENSAADESGERRGTTASNRQKSPHKLNMGGMVLRLAMRVLLEVDGEHT
eukprot:g9448.t1